MKLAYIDDFKIHDESDPSNPYFLTRPAEGLEFPVVSVTNYPRAGEDGTFTSGVFLRERRIALRGYITNVSSSSDLIVRRQALLEAFNPVRDDNGAPLSKTFRFTSMDGNEYRVLCQIIKVVMPTNELSFSEFLIDLLADRPYIESYNALTATIQTYTAGGFIVPFEVPIIMDSGSGGSVTINNTGNGPVYPIITLNGPLTNPRITNTSTGEFMALTVSLLSGQSIVIDMLERTIIQGGVTNLLGSKVVGSTFFGLNTGNNILTLTTSISSEAGFASLEYRLAYIGV